MNQHIIERVMLVDDSRIDNFINQKALERDGLAREILVYTRALPALGYLQDPDNNPLPSLILLDAVMPGMDGFEFISRFRELPAATRFECRIVMLSNMASAFIMKKRSEYPEVVEWIQKPLLGPNLETLRNVLTRPRKMMLKTS